jgi:hypothetical protein
MGRLCSQLRKGRAGSVTLVVVAILIIAWTWWGVVTWRDRRHSTGRRVNSIASFNNHLSVLERSGPATGGTGVRNLATPSVVGPYRPSSASNPWFAPGAPATDRLRGLVAGSPMEVSRYSLGSAMSRTLTLGEAQQRRRQVVFGLGAAVPVMALLALAFGGLFVELATVVTLAAVAYVVLLVRARRVEIERAVKVRNIAAGRAPRTVVATYAEPVNRGFGQSYGQGYGQDYGRTSAPVHGVADDVGYGSDAYDEPAYAGYAN